MAIKNKKKEILAQIGDPTAVARDLQSFRRAARLLSSKHPRMIDMYARQWIAVYKGRVRAQGQTYRSVLTQLDQKGIARSEVILRYIHNDERTMIL